MATYKVGYIIGSLAKESINRKLAGALVKIAPEQFEMNEIPIRDLPLYNYDYDSDFPPVARAFKAAIEASDALLFFTPEYNRSIPGALKNAIDWGGRPYGQNSFTGKPSAILGTSPGKIGTAIAQTHLHTILNYCGSPQMPSEIFVQFEKGLIDANGTITVESTEKFLRGFINDFAQFVARFAGEAERAGSSGG